MRRHLAISIIGTAALAFMACRESPKEAREELSEQQGESALDVAAAREEAAKDIGEERRELVGAVKEGQEEVGEAEARAGEEVREEREELQQARQQSFVGTVVDKSGNDFKLHERQSGKSLDFTLPDDARITSNGQPVSRDALLEGSEIRASAELRDGEWQASSVELMPEAQQPNPQYPPDPQPNP